MDEPTHLITTSTPELLSMCFEHFVFADMAMSVPNGKVAFRPLTVDLAFKLHGMVGDEECVDGNSVDMVIEWFRKQRAEMYDQDKAHEYADEQVKYD